MFYPRIFIDFDIIFEKVLRWIKNTLEPRLMLVKKKLLSFNNPLKNLKVCLLKHRQTFKVQLLLLIILYQLNL